MGSRSTAPGQHVHAVAVRALRLEYATIGSLAAMTLAARGPGDLVGFGLDFMFHGFGASVAIWQLRCIR